jgi:Uma2 family endonuclease
MATEPNQRLTIAEYLALERASELKHDYLDGEMFAMTGASRSHNRIVLNLGIELDAQLQDRDCEVFVNEMRVRTPTDLFTYPDAVVSCWRSRFDDSNLDTLLTPVVIFEVLSPSAESYDRTTKLSHYRTIPSLAEVAFIAQDRIHVEHWIRQADAQWLVREIEDLGQDLDLPSIHCKLPLARVYRRVFAGD